MCVTCSWVYNEELVASTLDLYRLLCNATYSKVEFVEATLTLPPSAQRLVGNEMLGILRRTGFEAINEVLSDEGRFFLGSVGSTHHWHSGDSLKGWFPHVELTVFELAYEKDKDRFVPIDLYLKSERLDMFNRLWRTKFMEAFGEVKTPQFVTYWHYGSGYATAEHRFGYQFRRPVLEAFEAVLKTRNLTFARVDWVKRMLVRPRKEKRHQWYGYLSDGIKSRYLQKMGISIDRKSVRDKARRRACCPACGDELVCVGHGTPYGELAKQEGSMILASSSRRRMCL
ncbi:MAG TPA: hypothetical protein VGS11_10485 [Candidatus Bathyarchaeia archaeon]|nr:hypothetical protein [Candidatus Bathyarchaeia archaeon]